MRATISINALYKYNPDLFDGIQFPETLPLNKNNLVLNLLYETMELEAAIADPDIMRAAISAWFIKELPIWQHLYNTTQYEYDPIYNYDRTETVTIERERAGETSETGSSTSRTSITDSQTDTGTRDITTTTTGSETGSTTGSGTNNEYVAAFEDSTSSDAATPATKKTDSTSETRTGSTTGSSREAGSTGATSSRTGSETGSGTESRSGTDSVEESETQSRHMYGNIGVTTTQQMIEQEREIAKFNLIDYIIDSFKARFCLLVY